MVLTLLGSCAPAAGENPAAVAAGRNQSPSLPLGPEVSTQLVRPLSQSNPPDTPPRMGYAPDPPVTTTRAYWQYRIKYDRGRVTVEKILPLCFEEPRASERRLGRFAFELKIGSELTERIRFDFPLLATEEAFDSNAPRASTAPPEFGRGATVSTQILIPVEKRALVATLVDRSNGSELNIPWPPSVPRETCP